MGFHPCGMVCDFIRRSYVGKMRTIKGGEPVDVVWFPAPVGAKLLPGLSPWGSSHWRDPTPYTGVGEEIALNDCTGKREVDWSPPIAPAPYTGQDYCGTPEAFADGAEPDSPDLFWTNEIGQAPCCASPNLMLWEGGQACGGESFATGAGMLWEGGSAEGADTAAPLSYVGVGEIVAEGTEQEN